MKLSKFSVERPVFTTMFMLIVTILGGVSLYRLPIDLMPEITYPTLSVITTYENAGPEEMEDLVTRHIEQAVSAVPGVEEVTSSSSDQNSMVRISFVWGTNLDEAANDIRDRLDRVIDDLPDGAGRPTLRKFDLSQFPILILGVTSNLDPVEVRRIVEEQVNYRFERVPGVAAVDVWGGVEREIQVRLFPEKVKALGLPVNQVIQTIKAQNVSIPTGTLEQGNYELMVTTAGTYTSLHELRETVITVRSGAPIQLKEIAEVTEADKKSYSIVKINGKPGLRISIQKQSQANTVDVAQAALKELEGIRQDIPQLDIIPLINTADYIERSITNVATMAGYGGLFAIVIFLLFLRNIRSTAIISTAIPISIIGTFIFVYFSGFTINLMTLGGLAIGVGMIVDSSIVVLENIYRLRKQGLDAKTASIEGSAEVTSAIIASTLTTLVIFLPLIFIRGMAGIMFKQLAYVISFALLCALIVALTLIPMLISRVSNQTAAGKAQSGNNQEKPLDPFTSAYRDLLALALKYKKTTVLVTAMILLGSLTLIPLVGVEYMPESDEGEVRVYVEMDVGTKLDVLDEKFERVEAIVKESVPEIENTVTRLGSSSWRASGGHSGRMQITLKSLDKRSRSSQEIANDLRQKLSDIPGVSIRTRAGQGLFIFRIVSGGGNERIQIDIRGYDLERANQLAQTLRNRIETVPGVTDIRLSLESGRPEEQIVVDRSRAADLKLSVTDIAENLQTILSGSRAGVYRTEGTEYDIIVKIKDAEQMALEDIFDLTIINRDNQPITLKNIVSVQSREAPVVINRKDQERVVTLSVNIAERQMNEILADIRSELNTIAIPREFSVVFSGDYEAQQEAFNELLVSILLAILLVYMVMACLYESLRDPLLVLFSVPLAIVGVILMLFLTNTTFNVQSFIGCIMLAGIVVNNAILMVDHINLLRERDGLAVYEAVTEAASRRLRPIMMTAMTTCLGMLPLSLGILEGSETQASMARVVIGGLASSTLITLIFIPVLYTIAEKLFPKRLEKRLEG